MLGECAARGGMISLHLPRDFIEGHAAQLQSADRDGPWYLDRDVPLVVVDVGDGDPERLADIMDDDIRARRVAVLGEVAER